ncbi:MAG: terminase family protein [Pseudomonadota bacterium]
MKEVLAALDDGDIARLIYDWPLWARAAQMPPTLEGWRTWVILGGRGAGKTRAGAEWVRAQALGLSPLAAAPARRIALVGETIAQVRAVMIEGVSGLLDVHPAHERPVFEASKQQLVWPNGSIAQMFSAEQPEALRGPQFAAAWCDELAKWRQAQATWDMLQFGMRLGQAPRVVVTTTPRATALLKDLMGDARTAVTRARTAENAANLAPWFMDEIMRRYGGTALGRQELDGEIVEERGTGLWQRRWIDDARLEEAPALRRIVVAVDPPVSAHAGSDACGIVVAGKGADARFYVLADRTLQGREPLAWARAVVAAYRDFAADKVVAEVNQGGDLVVAVLRQVDEALPVATVRATRGKAVRAEPVAALYAEGRVVHAGRFEALEDQMCTFGMDGRSGDGARSPDRVDALVWALTELSQTNVSRPHVRML